MPSSPIFLTTAAIASAFCRCASRGLLARDSTAIVTKATSGARFTTARPVATMTGDCGGRLLRRRRQSDQNAEDQAEHMILNPTLYAYVSGGTLWRCEHRSIDTSSLTHEPPRTIRMSPDSGPRGSRICPDP